MASAVILLVGLSASFFSLAFKPFDCFFVPAVHADIRTLARQRDHVWIHFYTNAFEEVHQTDALNHFNTALMLKAVFSPEINHFFSQLNRAAQLRTATGQPHTAHTNWPVALIYDGPRAAQVRLADGALCDLAPTLLALMGLAQPREMTGKSLVTGGCSCRGCLLAAPGLP